MTSKYIGVSFSRASRKYQATTIINGELIYIGTYSDERTAAKKVDVYRIKRGLEPKNILKPA